MWAAYCAVLTGRTQRKALHSIAALGAGCAFFRVIRATGCAAVTARRPTAFGAGSLGRDAPQVVATLGATRRLLGHVAICLRKYGSIGMWIAPQVVQAGSLT